MPCRNASPDFIFAGGFEQHGIGRYDRPPPNTQDSFFAEYFGSRRKNNVILDFKAFERRSFYRKVHIGAPEGYAGVDPDTVVNGCLRVDHDAKPAMQ